MAQGFLNSKVLGSLGRKAKFKRDGTASLKLARFVSSPPFTNGEYFQAGEN